jgi:prefoldin subunit 5
MDCESAIEALKKELEAIEAEKKRLMEEVVGLHVSQINFDNLKEKAESLSKALEGTKATK